MIAIKPVAESISSWPPYKAIIYKCAACGQSFSILGHRELYCHHCGTRVDWTGVPLYLKTAVDSNDINKEEKLIKQINRMNSAAKVTEY